MPQMMTVTTRRFWDAEMPVDVADILLRSWFGPDTVITDVTSTETDTLRDVRKVNYQIAVDRDSGPSVIEQVAY